MAVLTSCFPSSPLAMSIPFSSSAPPPIPMQSFLFPPFNRTAHSPRWNHFKGYFNCFPQHFLMEPVSSSYIKRKCASNLPLAQCKRKTSMIMCVKRIDFEDQSNSVVLFPGLLFQVSDPDKVSCATPMLAPTLLLIKYGSSDSPR